MGIFNEEEILAESNNYKVVVNKGRFQLVDKTFNVVDAEFTRLAAVLEALPVVQKELDEYIESYKRQKQQD